MSAKKNTIEKSLKSTKVSLEDSFNRMYSTLTDINQDELPSLKLRYLIEDYQELKKTGTNQ